MQVLSACPHKKDSEVDTEGTLLIPISRMGNAKLLEGWRNRQERALPAEGGCVGRGGDSLVGRPESHARRLARSTLGSGEKARPCHPDGLCPGGPGCGCVSGGSPECRERRPPTPAPPSQPQTAARQPPALLQGPRNCISQNTPFFPFFFFFVCIAMTRIIPVCLLFHP